MRMRWAILVLGLLFLPRLCFGLTLAETENSLLSLDAYFRNDLVSFKNVVDLDSRNKDDSTLYWGIDYSLGLKYELKNSGPQFYLKVERNGPYDYSAPLYIHNTLMTSGGTISKYTNDKLLPQMEEFWLDTPLGRRALRFKVGLYTYEVGNGLALNGCFENYGFTLYRETENFSWRFYYCRPELSYKSHLGPRIRQEEEQGIIYHHNASNFFATDAKFQAGKNSFQPYVGVLADYTSPGKRDNLFTAPIKKDLLGTLGLAWNLREDKFLLKAEAAHNFGKAESADPEYKDVQHTGYIFYSGLDYFLGKFTPGMQFLLSSGNKPDLEMALNQDATFTVSKNKAFSYYSPANLNPLISICNNASINTPVVAMGSGNGLNYGVPRPTTFSATDLDNLLMPSVSLAYKIAEPLNLVFFGYYLRSFQRGVGTFEGEAKFLSPELGWETDLTVDYQLNKSVLISFLGGCFFPGNYYKTPRDDTAGSLFSPFVRGDGKADNAFQLELSVETKF